MKGGIEMRKEHARMRKGRTTGTKAKMREEENGAQA
jgi:hypothetical protein